MRARRDLAVSVGCRATDDVELFERPAASVAADVFAPTLSRLDSLASDAAPAMRLARARACLRRWAKQLKN